MTAAEKAEILINIAKSELERERIKPYKSFENAVKTQCEYLLNLAHEIALQRNTAYMRGDKLKEMGGFLCSNDSLSDDEIREILVARKKPIGFNVSDTKNIFGAVGASGKLERNEGTVKIKLYSNKLDLERTKSLIEKLLPVGIYAEYFTSGGEWQFFDDENFTFSALDELNVSWKELEEKEW